MVSSEITERLRRLKVDVDNSPEFNSTATARVKAIVDSVLNVFLRLNKNVMGNGFHNPTQNIISNFGLSGNNSVKNRLTIMTNVDTLKNRINMNRELSPSVKQIAVSKLDMIKRVR